MFPKPVQEQYENWPYPHVPLLAQIPREQLWQLNLDWLRSRAGFSPKKNPKIWIAGCGTFQPYVFSRANPNASILASDLSQTSLKIAQKRCHLHGLRKVRFKQIDLEDVSSYPQETFDYIECYGVLMCLKDPYQVLKNLASRLSPQGIIRLMVYPHYGRQRIFHIQRLAKVLKLDYKNKQHPHALKKVLLSLPKHHPLRIEFCSYSDSQNPQGIVDAFLHASDTAYTGLQFGHMTAQAGLLPFFYFHKPWGLPQYAEDSLELPISNSWLALHYLDLWQELRTNFTICFTKEKCEAKKPTQLSCHPLIDLHNPDVGIRHKTRLLRLAITGVHLQSKTHENSLKLSGSDIRKLFKPKENTLPKNLKEILPTIQTHTSAIEITTHNNPIENNPHFCVHIGENVPNPFYQDLWDAFVFDRQWKSELPENFPDLKTQVTKWSGHADPLETKGQPFGFTPYGTYLYDANTINESLDKFLKDEVRFDFESIRLKDDNQKQKQVMSFLNDHRFQTKDFSCADLRILWILLFSEKNLFLEVSTQ